jgi:hypothetical protein
MPTVTHKIDEYSVQVYANDLRGNLTRWAAAVIYLYSSGKYVGSAYFARDGHTAPDCVYSAGIIYYHAQGEQYERVLDLLRNEEPVYLTWAPHSDTAESNDGDAYVYSGREPVGEEEH